MTGKVIDNSAPSLLILIVPIAFLTVVLFNAWPVLLALLIVSVGFSIWQQYRWKQWSKQVNPFFNQLIKENQGCLTVLDLSMKANLTASAATRFLDRKAEEFGAQRKVYEDKGTVYYFLTASALGSIFDDSEPSPELESQSSTSPAPKLIDTLLQSEPNPSQHEASVSYIAESGDSAVEETPNPSPDTSSADIVEPDVEPPSAQKQEQTHHANEKENLWIEPPSHEPEIPQSLIQSELAKRLDVHSSTVGKRKTDPDFPEWSQSRDPDGIAWEYSPETKEFSPVNKTSQPWLSGL